MKRLVLLTVTLVGVHAVAEPRFAARTGLPCVSCHVNPSGGGLRTAYGRDVFNKAQLSMLAGSALQRAVDFDPRVADLFTFGMDFRVAYIGQPTRLDNPAPGVTAAPAGLFIKAPARHSVFPMQADLYLAADITKYATLYLDYGVHGSFEVTGLLHNLPLGLFARVGMFTPAYGLKLANHTASIRQPIGFDPRTAKDSGLEVGLINRWLEVQFAVQNGDPSGQPFAGGEGFALTGRAAARGQLGPLKLSAGVSGRRVQNDIKGGSGRLPRLEFLTGAFATASVGRFTYLAEFDFHLIDDHSQPAPAGGPTRSGQFVTYQDVRFLAARGVDIGLTHEFMDRDIFGRAAPADVVNRLGVEVALFPAPYLHIELFGRTYLARADREEQGQWEVVAFVHLFF